MKVNHLLLKGQPLHGREVSCRGESQSSLPRCIHRKLWTSAYASDPLMFPEGDIYDLHLYLVKGWPGYLGHCPGLLSTFVHCWTILRGFKKSSVFYYKVECYGADKFWYMPTDINTWINKHAEVFLGKFT